MTSSVETEPGASSLAKSALDGGLTMLLAASSGAKTGAKLAVGTLFAGCNVLLDLGVRVARRLPLEEGVHLETGGGTIPVVARPAVAVVDGQKALGWWTPDGEAVEAGEAAVGAALRHVKRPLYIVDLGGRPAVGVGGRAVLGADTLGSEPSYPLRAFVPAVDPAMLGDAAFREAHSLRYAYAGGSMANGIASEEMVEALARAGMLGFFGAAGLTVGRIEAAIDRLDRSLGEVPHGFNLIYSPNEPEQEAAVAGLYLRRGVRLVEASAYMDLTLPLVRYRVHGIHRDSGGRVVCPNRVLAKASRVEVARRFLSPPPAPLLQAMVEAGDITREQAELARCVPVAEDLTAEADSGGHTDSQQAMSLIPTMIVLRDEIQAKYGYQAPPRVGAAGGIATPASAAAALAMGAAYIMTGSVNQACVEAGTSRAVREMLAQARQADVTMAPAADMFEMGVKVQVLKWGTMFAVRARKLYELYRAHGGLEDIPAGQRAVLERDYFRCSLAEAWEQARRFWEQRDPRQAERAEADPKHQMALVFRSYLGQASEWAIAGDAARKADYQVWCGPAMGAFNEWARGSHLEAVEHRDVVSVAMNLLLGAAVETRAHWLAVQGVGAAAAGRVFLPLDRTGIDLLLSE